MTVNLLKSPLEGGRPLRNCPVGNFREEPDCRGDCGGVRGGYKTIKVYSYENKQ